MEFHESEEWLKNWRDWANGSGSEESPRGLDERTLRNNSEWAEHFKILAISEVKEMV